MIRGLLIKLELYDNITIALRSTRVAQGESLNEINHYSGCRVHSKNSLTRNKITGAAPLVALIKPSKRGNSYRRH